MTKTLSLAGKNSPRLKKIREKKAPLPARTLLAKESLARLINDYPAAFNVGQPKPFKKGIHLDIRKAYPDVDHDVLREALNRWCQRKSYQVTLTETGPRYDLAGEVAGEVTEEQVIQKKADGTGPRVTD